MTSYANSFAPWIIFNLFVGFFLALDLGVFHKKSSIPTYGDALKWSLLWVILALLFAGWVVYDQNLEWGTLFLTGYVIEKSLSLDNIMVFAIIFQTLNIPLPYQHKVLFWGIIGALGLRFTMIWGGSLLLEKFHFVTYVFGGLLILSGLKIFFISPKTSHWQGSFSWHLLEKILPFSKDYQGQKFFIKQKGKIFATPLLMALFLIELSDIVFAVDSIPAIFAITRDPFMIYTSNVFAILGLRSLYFLLANAMNHLRFLKKGLALILCFVGFKMLGLMKIPTLYSLAIILVVLGGASLASWSFKEKNVL